MSNLSNHYQKIIKELAEHFQDEQERNYVLERVQELSMMFMDIIDRLTYITDMRVKDVEEKQREIEGKIATVQKIVDGIENDIYEDEESYEFEIVCPYCNHEFVTDINSQTSNEVECPECHNIIELDWEGGDEDEFGTCREEEGCSHCMHECEEKDYDVEDNEEDVEVEEQNNEQKKVEKKQSKNEAKQNKKSNKQKQKQEDEEEINEDEDM